MAYRVYVSGYKRDTTLEDLIIYFQSDVSNVGDIDDEQCEINKEGAVIVFEDKKDQQRILKRNPCKMGSYTLIVSEKPTKPKTTTTGKAGGNGKDAKISDKPNEDNNVKPVVGEITTVIVGGISPETSDETLELFFENKKRSGGGDIKHFKRVQPQIAHVTYKSSEVAQRVLKREKLVEVEGYLLDLKAEKPNVTFPLERKKLLIENIRLPDTTEDSLCNYVEIITGVAVVDVVIGKKNNAIVVLKEEPDMNKVCEKAKKKALERSKLKISNPPVCHSILVTGLSQTTTKDTIELKFETPKNGGGEILEILHNKTKGEAVISFYDPSVLKTLTCKELDNARLTIRPYHPFMEDDFVVEDQEKMIKVTPDIMDHVSNQCDEEFFAQYGLKIHEMQYDEASEELCITKDMDKIEGYFNQFVVEEILVAPDLATEAKSEIHEILDKNATKVTTEFNEEKQRIILTGKKKKVKKCKKTFESQLTELEKKKEISTTELSLLDKNKLVLMSSLRFEDMLDPKINVKIDHEKSAIQIKGPRDLVEAVKAKALEEYSQLSEECLDLNQTQVKHLELSGLQTVNKCFENKKLKATLCLDKTKPNKAVIVWVKSENAGQIKQLVHDKIYQQCYTVDEESCEVLHSAKWAEMENQSKEAGVMMSVEGDKIWLTGEATPVQRTKAYLTKFVELNTIVGEDIPFDLGIVRYLQKYCEKDIRGIKNTLKNYVVKIQWDGDEGIRIQGTKHGVKEAKKKLQDIAGHLVNDKVLIEPPGIQKHLKTETGRSSLKGLENEHECTITIANEMPRRGISSVAGSSTSATTPLCSYETPEKITMLVYQADITKHKCDVLVNAANEDLSHIGGLAWAVVNNGGKEIQNECHSYVKNHRRLTQGEFYRGGAGRLPCKNIIHVVGPRWDNFNRVKHMNVLHNACENIFKDAGKKDKIIALPAVGSGVFGVPRDICANVMVDAAIKWSSKGGEGSSLREIHFVNNDTQTAQVFVKEFRKQFGDHQTYRGGASQQSQAKEREVVPLPTRDYRKYTPASVRAPISNGDSITTKTQRISVVIGDISTHKADVLVNTTSEQLDLSRNPCSRAYSSQGGPALQKKCNEMGRIKVGEVGETPATGNLQCTSIYHVVCVQYDNGKGEPVLRSIIKECLKECDSARHSSIAFPAIGTGILGFPHNVTAKICFEEVKKFGEKYQNSSVNDIRFVVYHKDQASIKAFKEEVKRQPGWKTKTSGPSRKDLRSAVGDDEDGKEDADAADVIKDENDGISIALQDGSTIRILKGDITKEKTDVIAHLSNEEGSMNGGVAKALMKSGGKAIEKQRTKEGKIQLYGTVLTKAGNLNVRAIAHMAGPDGPNEKDIEKCVTNCLQKLTNQNYRSVSFPAIGTGQLSMPAKISAQAMFTAIVKFLQNSPGLLDTVRIVIYDQNVLKAFLPAAKQLFGGEKDDESPGLFRSIMRGISNLFSTPDPPLKEKGERGPGEPMELIICAGSKQILGDVKIKIERIIEEQMKKAEIKDNHIEELSTGHKKQIIKECEKNDVKVDIEKHRITMEGHKDDVFAVQTKISSIINESKLAKKEEEKAKLLTHTVQWCWFDDESNNYEDYPLIVNAQIEIAHKEKQNIVKFDLKEGACQIDLKAMIETNLTTGQKTKVTRKDLNVLAISLPGYWDPQPQNSNGKEETVHLVSLDQTNHAAEYKRISDGFLQTGGGMNIAKIERIQNPSLFRLYSTKKQNMDERHGSNEKILYHGTAASNVQDINQNGLNRNYKGRHGTAHGHGIYFARDASMSAGYAKPDAAGNRCMYVARVAVGEHAQSHPNMIVPPDKPGAVNEKFDSVVDNLASPRIFVMFYDNEYYPEYLITFR